MKSLSFSGLLCILLMTNFVQASQPRQARLTASQSKELGIEIGPVDITFLKRSSLNGIAKNKLSQFLNNKCYAWQNGMTLDSAEETKTSRLPVVGYLNRFTNTSTFELSYGNGVNYMTDLPLEITTESWDSGAVIRVVKDSHNFCEIEILSN